MSRPTPRRTVLEWLADHATVGVMIAAGAATYVRVQEGTMTWKVIILWVPVLVLYGIVQWRMDIYREQRDQLRKAGVLLSRALHPDSDRAALLSEAFNALPEDVRAEGQADLSMACLAADAADTQKGDTR